MNNQSILWIDHLEKLIQQKHMLSHPFYQAWTRGVLTKATLQTYVKEYYQHVKAFPTYLSSLHSRCNDLQIRKHLLTNLMDEESGCPNHLDLWKSFALAIGVDPKDLDLHKPQKATQELIDHFHKNCSQSLSVGVATLYSYESQIPTICQTKIDGLKKWYGLKNPESYQYFSVHETVDIEHSHTEKNILLDIVQPGEEKVVLEAVKTTLDTLGNFLSSFHV
ncbi:MAG: CADD family putative folate metabolism protein [Chlamydiales bacterium]|jgi:pyrroloquinoline-quinone synthase|nr:CADD family putative folate metabolism protein [Chlamydiales bacterium]